MQQNQWSYTGWKNWTLLSHLNATLAQQAKLSGKIFNYMLSRYSDILSMIIGLHSLSVTLIGGISMFLIWTFQRKSFTSLLRKYLWFSENYLHQFTWTEASLFQVLLLQCHQSEDSVAQTLQLWYHPPGQAPDTETEHRTKTSSEKWRGQAQRWTGSDQFKLKTDKIISNRKIRNTSSNLQCRTNLSHL